MEVEFAFELVENLIAGIDVIILAAVRTAGDEGDEIGILPDDSPLSPVAAVFVDPVAEIESLQMRKHRASLK
jgi:hypothetical protein